MTDKNIDEILKRTEPVDPALLNRVSSTIACSLDPVRPLAPLWVLAVALVCAAAICASAAAYIFGFNGLQKLPESNAALIFPVLAISLLAAALASASAMAPGASVRINPRTLLIVILAAWLGVDAALFHNYTMDEFVREGVPCLRAGLIVAAPAGAASWVILRRGFAVNPGAAGLAAGTLAGLAGLIMLEFHCAHFEAPHIMFWHTAVVPISALAGALVAALARR